MCLYRAAYIWLSKFVFESYMEICIISCNDCLILIRRMKCLSVINVECVCPSIAHSNWEIFKKSNFKKRTIV